MNNKDLVKKIKILRERSRASLLECKKALEESDGDVEKAFKILKQRGALVAEKKVGRETKEGTIGIYLHQGGRVGAMVELLCETDFVAKNDLFQKLAKELAIQIAGYDPFYLSPAEVDKQELKKLREQILDESADDLKNKPEEVSRRIIDGKLNKYLAEHSLLAQPFFRSEELSVENLIKEHIAKLGENIRVGKFVRFEI